MSLSTALTWIDELVLPNDALITYSPAISATNLPLSEISPEAVVLLLVETPEKENFGSIPLNIFPFLSLSCAERLMTSPVLIKPSESELKSIDTTGLFKTLIFLDTLCPSKDALITELPFLIAFKLPKSSTLIIAGSDDSYLKFISDFSLPSAYFATELTSAKLPT